jgi:hypothetical protein
VDGLLTRFPDTLTALDVDGRRVRLVDLAADGPVLFVFLRHFG